MAKKSKIAKERQRQEMVEKYAELRKELKAKGDYEALQSYQEIHPLLVYIIVVKLQEDLEDI